MSGIARAQQGDQNYIGFDHQCFNKPRTYTDAVQDLLYLELCMPQARGCFQPPAPELDSDGSIENVQAQTVLIKANKSGGFDPAVVIWEGAYLDPNAGLTTLWQVRSKSSINPGQSTAYTVRYGATGLVEKVANYFRVAYCSELSPGVLDRCTCFSAYSEGITTDAFHGVAPPGPLCQEVEDSFERFNTTAVPTGDGLGPPDPMLPTLPPGVWAELTLFGTSAGHGTIVSKSRAHLEEGAYIYRRRASSDPRAYAEAFYFRDPMAPSTVTKYDVDVMARLSLGGNGTVPIGYDLKLENEAASGGSIRLYRPAGISLGTEIASWNLTTALGPKCSGTVPLENDVTTGVWVQIEVDDDGTTPTIDMRVGWSGAACGPDGRLSEANCGHYCEKLDFRDSGAPTGLQNKVGSWAMFPHHRDYEAKNFRAGSKYAQACP